MNPLRGPISQLQPGTQVLATDVYAATDTTDLTQSPSGTTKKYTVNQLLSFALDNYARSNITSGYVSTVSDLNATYVNGPNNDGIGATLTNAGPFAPLTIDGIALLSGQRVLVAYQTAPAENGVYTVTDAGDVGTNWVLTRATDYDGSAIGQINQGDFIGILFGNVNALSWFFMTANNVANVGVDPITFSKQVNVLSEPWVNQTTSPLNMAVNTGYTTSAGATQILYGLPPVAAVGSYVEINGHDAGGFQITQTVGQQVNFGTTSTTLGVGGSITANDQFCNIRLRCIEANNIWTVSSFVGSFTIV